MASVEVSKNETETLNTLTLNPKPYTPNPKP